MQLDGRYYEIPRLISMRATITVKWGYGTGADGDGSVQHDGARGRKIGLFPIHYLVTYREEEGGSFRSRWTKVFYVRVKGKDDDELSADAGEQDRTKARIIVDSFETLPAEIYAGQPF